MNDQVLDLDHFNKRNCYFIVFFMQRRSHKIETLNLPLFTNYYLFPKIFTKLEVFVENPIIY